MHQRCKSFSFPPKHVRYSSTPTFVHFDYCRPEDRSKVDPEASRLRLVNLPLTPQEQSFRRRLSDTALCGGSRDSRRKENQAFSQVKKLTIIQGTSENEQRDRTASFPFCFALKSLHCLFFPRRSSLTRVGTLPSHPQWI